MLELAYAVMMYHCITASEAARAARIKVEYKITWKENIIPKLEVREGTNIPKSFVISGQNLNGWELGVNADTGVIFHALLR